MVRVNAVEMLLEMSSEVVFALPVYTDNFSLKPPCGSHVQSASEISYKTNTSWTWVYFLQAEGRCSPFIL